MSGPGYGARAKRVSQPSPLTIGGFVSQLVKVYGTPAKLAQAVNMLAPPTERRVDAQDVAAWTKGRTLPETTIATIIASLLGEQASVFWKCYADAQAKGAQPVRDSPRRHISVYGLSWLGTRTNNFAGMCDFCEKSLGLHLVHRCARDHAIYRTDNGDHVALYGRATSRYELFSTGPVVGFRVGNIVAARSELEAKGTRFLGPICSKDNGKWKYTHFIAPDDNIYELVEEGQWSDLNEPSSQEQGGL